MAVFIPPSANAKEALSELHHAICKQNILRLDKAYTNSKGAHKLLSLSHVSMTSQSWKDCKIFRDVTTLNNHMDLQEYTVTVTDCIKKCVDDVTTMKTITVHSSQDAAALKTARNNLARGIRRAKQQDSARITNNFANNRDPRRL